MADESIPVTRHVFSTDNNHLEKPAEIAEAYRRLGTLRSLTLVLSENFFSNISSLFLKFCLRQRKMFIALNYFRSDHAKYYFYS
jgi:hypothetical protein